MSPCKFEKGCVLHAILTHPKECNKKETQQNCTAFERFTCMPHRFELAKIGMEALKDKEEKTK